MTILLVDDNEPNLYQLQVLLAGNGYQVVTAVNGAEALTKARENPPDLIVSDILMPVMDGFGLCREWKKDERLRQIPFVFYTATYTDERDREFALSLGAEQFLVKPEEPEVFIRTIREVIQQIQRPPVPLARPAANTPARLPVQVPQEEEAGYLKQYNEVLIRKLEAKMQQLKQANRELERDITERKRAEEALRESGERTRIVAESVTDVIYEWDLKDKVEWYGDVDTLMGYPAGGFPRTLDGWRATLHPEDKERVWLAIESQLKGVAPYKVDYRVAGKDGRWRWWSARGGVLRDEQGEPRRWVGAITDITERKRAEEALQESGTAFRTLAEVVPQLVWMCTPDGLTIYFNQRWVDYTGLTLEESYGRGWTTPFHADDKQAAWDAWNHAVESGGKYSIECRLRGADGTYRWFLTRGVPLRDATGGIVKWFGTYTDIDDLKRAEQDLVQSHERLAMALRVGQSGTFEWDIQNNINVWSPQVEALYGVERGMFGGTYQDWESFLLPEDLETAKSGIQESLKSGEFKGEWRIRRHSDGEIRWLGARAKVLFDEAGRPTHMIGINTDITERKRAEEEVQKLNQHLEQRVRERTAELEAANEELEAFTYSVSHDLRAPLRHVDGFSKLLVEQHQAGLSPDAQEYVATIRDSVLQMGVLIDDLLNLTHVGRKQLVMQVTGLNSLVEEVRTDLNRANPDCVIEWKVETLPFVECDAGLMKQVFANLLSNAVKFTRPRKPAVIEVGAIRQDDHPVVFVRDNGVGFSMKYANKLFGVFQRLHRTEDFEGSGVGLATVQRIIHKHGGRVWAEAELDKGATFYFTLGSPDDPAAGKASSGSI